MRELAQINSELIRASEALRRAELRRDEETTEVQRKWVDDLLEELHALKTYDIPVD